MTASTNRKATRLRFTSKFNRAILLGFLLCGCSFCSVGQSPYLIDISREAPMPGGAAPLSGGVPVKMGTSTAPSGDALSMTSRYLLRDGQPWFPIMGEMHYSRCAARDWE